MEKTRIIRPEIEFSDVEFDFREIFDSGHFTKGKHVYQFARELAQYTEASYAYLTTSATTALWVSLKAIGIEKGDEVAVADFSFPATANVVEDLGARPIFVDVDRESFNMDSLDLKKKISKRTKAVIFVDTFGNPTGLHDIKEICEGANLPLIEDAACAIGSSERGIHCGGIADLTCFSFHPRKLLCTGEGGAVTTNSPSYAKWLDVKLAHGADISNNGVLNFVEFGYNFRLPELQSAMGRKQLAKLDYLISERNEIRNRYINCLNSLGFIPQFVAEDVTHNVQSVVFRIPDIDRDMLIRRLAEAGVETTIGTYCQSGGKYFREKYNDIQPISKELQSTTITLPCYNGLDVDFVVSKIEQVLNG